MKGEKRGAGRGGRLQEYNALGSGKRCGSVLLHTLKQQIYPGHTPSPGPYLYLPASLPPCLLNQLQVCNTLKNSKCAHPTQLSPQLTPAPRLTPHSTPHSPHSSTPASFCLFVQSKSSCMPAHALNPSKGWLVMDCCAAPGNKTTHVAALLHAMGGGRCVAVCGEGQGWL